MGSPCPGGVTYVALRLLSTRPSRTTPAPTLLAEPSRPSTVGMAAAPPLRGRFRLPGGGTSARWPIPELLPGRLPVTPSATSATPQRHFRCPPTARFSRPITGVATRQLPVILRAASALFQHNFWCTPPRELLGQSLRSIGATSGAPLRHFRSAFSSTSGARPQLSFVHPPFPWRQLPVRRAATSAAPPHHFRCSPHRASPPCEGTTSCSHRRHFRSRPRRARLRATSGVFKPLRLPLSLPVVPCRQISDIAASFRM